jgi:hypothetical protein
MPFYLYALWSFLLTFIYSILLLFILKAGDSALYLGLLGLFANELAGT